jgi:hypothetical protein
MGIAAFAASKLPYDSSRPPVAIQNATGMAPTAAASGCVTQTLTKGTFGTYTGLSGYMQYEAEVVTAAGVAEPVKWQLDGTQVATGSSFKMVNPSGTAYSRAVQQPYSAVGRALTLCVRRR